MTIPPLVGHSVDHENQRAESLNLSSVWHAAFQPQELPGWHCVSAYSTKGEATWQVSHLHNARSLP